MTTATIVEPIPLEEAWEESPKGILESLIRVVKENPKTVAVTSAVAGGAYIFFLAGQVVSNGLVTGIIITAGFIILYYKLPGRVKSWIRAHNLASDIIFSLLAYLLIGAKTITGLIGAAFVGLFISLFLLIEKGRRPRKERVVA